MQNTTFIIDFDSTFINVETLDVLAEVSLSDDPEFQAKLDRIQEITNICMGGGMSFRQSLIERLKILNASETHLNELVDKLKTYVSASVQKNKEFFQTHNEDIYIISSGFKQCIAPVVAEYGIDEDHVFANDFTFDDVGNVSGFDATNPLSANNGKATIINGIGLTGNTYMIGDGYNDYEVKKAGAVTAFYAYTENIHRENVIKEADKVFDSFDAILKHHSIL